MIIITLKNHNNYFNRIVKKALTYAEAQTNKLDEYGMINFNPNDGVNTELVLNFDGAITPDYLIAYDDTTKERVSSWFVLEAVRVRKGQYKLALRRDLLGDYYNDVLDAPIFVEKAHLKANNPLIFNNEGMTFNQIKQKEILIKDETKSGWIVGYYAKNTSPDNLTGVVALNSKNNLATDSIPVPLNQWEYYQFIENDFSVHSGVNFTINFANIIRGTSISTPTIIYVANKIKLEESGISINRGYLRDPRATRPLDAIRNETVQDDLFVMENKMLSASIMLGYETIKTVYDASSGVKTPSELNDFLNYDGKVIVDSEGKYYSISISIDSTSSLDKTITSSDALYSSMSNVVNIANSLPGTRVTGANDLSFEASATVNNYRMTVTEIPSSSITYDMRGQRIITEDSEYNIFAIPYSDEVVYQSYAPLFTNSKDLALAAAQSIAKNMGSSCYDLQIIPYCPIRECIGVDDADETVISLDYFTDKTGYFSFIKEGSNNVGVIFNIKNSQLSFRLDDPIWFRDYYIQSETIPEELKIQNECNVYRICSPNYSGSFDFSVAKNNGLNGFIVDMNLKPYSPYIHLSINFKNLYGSEFGDARGLICGGDFSLSRISDAFEQYQLNNKNYQIMFDREVQNLDFMNAKQKEMDIFSAITGTVAGGIEGAQSGKMTGSVGATVAGAVIGTAASALGGILDVRRNEEIRAENRDLKIDMFNYSLGNIKAMPYSLTKVSSLNANNKVFPFLEVYSCTDEEKEAFRNKLQYNGMTVMTIGTIRQYLDEQEKHYFKGQLIRLESLSEDTHLVQEIYSELNKGVYI